MATKTRKKKPNLGVNNGKMGTPVKTFDWKKLDILLSYTASLVDCAEILEVSEDTVQKRIKDKYSLTFTAYREKKMAKTRVRLAQKAIDLGLSGDRTMLIFSLKNLNKWSDTVTHDLADKAVRTFTLNYQKPGSKKEDKEEENN